MDKGGDGTMRANGNGAPNVCASNLLRLIRGEVPYGLILADYAGGEG